MPSHSCWNGMDNSAMSDTVITLWKIFILIALYLIGMTGVAIQAYIASSRHFSVMLDALQRSQGLHKFIGIWGVNTLKGRTMLVETMASALWSSNYCLKRGLLHRDDLEAFPVALRKRMKLGSALVLLGCIGMILQGLGMFPYGSGQ